MRDTVQRPGPVMVDWATGTISGEQVEESVKRLGELAGIFADTAAWSAMDPETEVYRVRFWKPVPDGTTGGLFWGATILEPGRVGDEYFMTHGHFHAIRDRAEFYATVKGQGALLLMDESGRTSSQSMRPGTVHYVPGSIAHRAANTGDQPLVFLASWPSDAGHDYGSIRTSGFSKRMVRRDGLPCLV
jgi:glucose-6-phosphate isomerase, archaeal